MEVKLFNGRNDQLCRTCALNSYQSPYPMSDRAKTFYEQVGFGNLARHPGH